MRFLGLACVLGWLAVPCLAADETVFLKSEPTEKWDVVKTDITRTREGLQVLNLGYAHGVNPDDQFLVVRMRQGFYDPVCLLRVTRVDADFSFARVTEGAAPELTDLALISAAELDLWGHPTRVGRTYDLRHERQPNRQGYDTRTPHPLLVRELVRDDRMTRYEMLRTGIVHELRTQGELEKDLRPVERYALAKGGTVGVTPPPMPNIRGAKEEQTALFAESVRTATAALGLYDTAGRFAFEHQPALKGASRKYRDQLIHSAIRHLGRDRLSASEIQGIDRILSRIVVLRLRGELAQTSVEETALAQLHREVSQLETPLMWARFISEAAANVNAENSGVSQRF